MWALPAILRQPPLAQAKPTVEKVQIVSSPQGGSGTPYLSGEHIRVQVRFSEEVRVATSGGWPRLALTTGTETRYGSYINLSEDRRSLVFSYQVQGMDEEVNRISIPANALTLNGGIVQGSASPHVNAELEHGMVDNDPDHKARENCLGISGLANATVKNMASGPVTPTLSHAIGTATSWALAEKLVNGATLLVPWKRRARLIFRHLPIGASWLLAFGVILAQPAAAQDASPMVSRVEIVSSPQGNNGTHILVASAFRSVSGSLLTLTPAALPLPESQESG